jgi:hypothetical protein
MQQFTELRYTRGGLSRRDQHDRAPKARGGVRALTILEWLERKNWS